MKQQTPINQSILYQVNYEHFGTIEFRALDIEQDIALIHKWVNRPYAVFWGLQGSTIEQVREEYNRLTEPEHYDVFIGLYNGKIAFLLERYDPKQDIIANYYSTQVGDCGIHILVAPANRPIPNFTWYVFNAITKFMFSNTKVQRLIVEPDIQNKKMFAICERIGFVLDKIITLPHKTAQLAFYTRTNFTNNNFTNRIIKRSAMNTINNTVSPQQAIAHIKPDIWALANRLLVKKSICEFSHERILEPELVEITIGWNRYRLKTPNGEISYTFQARLLELNHFYIQTESIKKYRNNEEQDLDALLFIKEFSSILGLEKERLAIYLEEITSTLYSSAYKHVKGNPRSKDLVHADFQTIEQAMMEGHPGFVANNGRIGFDSGDYRAYAPEAGNSFLLLWLAGHKDRTHYAGTEDLDYQTLIHKELDPETIQNFNNIIKSEGFKPEDYYFMPVHPWQWFNKLSNIFAPEIAQGKLLCLGYGKDQYFAQQSIRTLFNSSNPHKFYTKTSLSILNMGFMRGLPYYYLGTAPKMAVWLENLLTPDAYIQETGFAMLGEIASVSYVNPYYKELGPHNDYNKMIASLWRESPISKIQARQSVMTMAALLHIDQNGDAFLPELIKSSGLSIDNWLRKYLKAYLSPLVHCFYQYDLVFMPHGENIILVLDDNIPTKVLLKDITEEAVILNPDVALPSELERMYAPVAEDVKLLSIFIDVFDGFFRFLSHILVEHCNYDEQRFWALVAENIKDYQQRFPQLQAKFEQYDLFAPDFQLSCLNRLQLNNNKQMIDLDDPTVLLQFIGKLNNPIAPYKHQNSPSLETIVHHE